MELTSSSLLSAATLKEAKRLHEWFMISLGAQLLLIPAAIVLDLGRWGVLLPLLVWFGFYLVTQRVRRQTAHPFVTAHAALACRRYHGVAIGYLITVLLFGVSALVESAATSHSPQQLLAVALLRIGVMPTIIAIFVGLVLGNSALSVAAQGEFPGTPRRSEEEPTP